MERKRLTEAQKNAIRQMHADGKTMTAIVEKLGIPRKAVRNVCYVEDCRLGIRTPLTLQEKSLRKEAIKRKEIRQMKNSLQIGQQVTIYDREYASDGVRGHGAVNIVTTVATICELSKHFAVIKLPGGTRTSFTYTDLIREDGVRV